MYRNPGLDTPIHGSLSTPRKARPASGNRQMPGMMTEPFTFSRLFLVMGIVLAIVTVTSLVSG